MYIYSVLNFQRLTQEKDVTPRSFSLEEYITTLYHLPNFKMNVENIYDI